MQALTDQVILQSTRLDASHNQARHGATHLVWPLYPPTQPLAFGAATSAPLFVSSAFTGTPPLSRSSSRTSTAASTSSLATPILQNLITHNVFQENVDQYDATLDATAPLVPTLAPPLLCASKIATGFQPSHPLPLPQHQTDVDYSSGSSYVPTSGGSGSYVGDVPGGEAGGTTQAAPSGLPVSYQFTFTASPQMANLQDTFAAMEQGSLCNQSTPHFSEDFGVQPASVHQPHASNCGGYFQAANVQSPESLGVQAPPTYQQHASSSGSYPDSANFQPPENLGGQPGLLHQHSASNSGSYPNGANFQSPEYLGLQAASTHMQASNSESHHENLQFLQSLSVQPGLVYEQHVSHSGNHHLQGANPQFFTNVGMQPGPVYQQRTSNFGGHHLQGINPQHSTNVGVQPRADYQEHASYLQNQANLQFPQNFNVQAGPVYEQHASNSGNNVTAAAIHHVPNAGLNASNTNLGTNPTYRSVFVASTNRNSDVARINGGLVQTTTSDANPVQGTLPVPSAALHVQQIQPGGLSTVSTRPVGIPGKRGRTEFEGKSSNQFSEPPKKQVKTLPVAKKSNTNAGSEKPKRVVKVKERKRGIPCPDCGKPVTPGRRRHHETTTTHLQVVNPKVKILGKWLCELCDRRFTRNDACFRHQERRHGGRFPEEMTYDPQSIPIENIPPQSQ
ncbi:hypothetical protein EDC04DRAFT_2144730 [Pisolithus marmoratus]|nr:hypothetical protein EDC04DRAFT_2144730 [Pisolithus marmoratus]